MLSNCIKRATMLSKSIKVYPCIRVYPCFQCIYNCVTHGTLKVERVGAVNLPGEQLVDHRRAELPRRPVSASLLLVHVHNVGRELVTSLHLRPLLALALVTSDIGVLVVLILRVIETELHLPSVFGSGHRVLRRITLTCGNARYPSKCTKVSM